MVEMTWVYKAEDRTGGVVRGELIAASEAAALSLLHKDELQPLAITPRKARQVSAAQDLFSNTRLSLNDYASLARGLADLLSAGVSLNDALSLLAARQRKARLKRFLETQLRKVRGGTSFSNALEQDKTQVPRLMSALVAAGEASGTLGSQLMTLADAFETQAKLRRELIGQLIYPAALCVMIFLTLVFLSYFVLPQFETIFTGADTLPPPETRLVLAAGAWIRDYGALLPAFGLGSVVILKLLQRRYSRQYAQMLLTLPMVGTSILKMEAGRYCRSLGALLRGGTSLSKALPIAIKAVSSLVLRDRHETAAAAIRAGQGFVVAMESQALMPDDVLSLAEIGERSGKLGPMLIKAADLCETDIKHLLTRITTLAGPVLTAVMGLITAAVIASVMSGVLSLNETVY